MERAYCCPGNACERFEVASDQLLSMATVCLTCNRQFDADQNLCPFDGGLLAPLKQDPLVGKILKDYYEVLSPAGHGATSVVYKARHNLMLRTVALKILKKSTSEDMQGSKRLQREALALSSFDHPGIISLYDCGRADGDRPFLVMEYLKGDNLSNLVQQRGMLPVNRAIPIFLQVIEALHHMHLRGVVHRDLKPENILVAKNDLGRDAIKIVDFGIAKFSDGAPPLGQELNANNICGTMPYMSPEHADPSLIDERSDVYSIGIVMYECLVGSRPFQGENLLGWLKAHKTQTPPTFKTVRSDLHISMQLESVVMRCLAKDPATRFPSMDALRRAISELALDNVGFDMRREISLAIFGEDGVLRSDIERLLLDTVGAKLSTQISAADSLLNEVDKDRPNAIVASLSTWSQGGWHPLKELKKTFPYIKVLVDVPGTNPSAICQALYAGADACMDFRQISHPLALVLQVVISGGTWVDPSIRTSVFRQASHAHLSELEQKLESTQGI